MQIMDTVHKIQRTVQEQAICHGEYKDPKYFTRY